MSYLRTQVRCLRCGFALGIAVFCLSAVADDGGDLDARRAEIDRTYREAIQVLAAKCDELGLSEAADVTRHWQIRRDPRRRYFFAAPETDPARPPRDASDLTGKWYQHFRRLRADQADRLFTLGEQHLAAGQPQPAFALLYEVLRENPDHETARRALGFRQIGGRWESPDADLRVERARLGHPKFGWRPRSYWYVETEHFRIATNHSEEAGLELAERMEELNAVWRQLFVDYWGDERLVAARFSGRAAPARLQAKYRVVLFRDRSEYVGYLKRFEPRIEISRGLYRDTDRTVYFYAVAEDSEATWFHEAAHQLFHETGDVAAGIGLNQNFWAIEGVALYMESLRRHEGYFTLGGIDAGRLQYARYRALNQNIVMPLAELVTLGRDGLKQHEDIAALYSQAAGLAHFFMDSGADRYHRAFVDYLRAVYMGRDRPEALARLCGVSYEQLDAEYRRFLEVRDNDLKALEGNQQTTHLSLGSTSVTDQGMAHLAGLKKLQWLDLAFTNTSDAGLTSLKDLANLRQLTLVSCPITDAGLKTVAAFTQLEELDLSGTGITDAGLVHLVELENLRSLRVIGTAITDAGLNHLTKLKTLESLDAGRTQVTVDGLKRLKQKLPSLKRVD